MDKKVLTGVFLVFVLALLACTIPACAADDSVKTVTVGYYPEPCMMDGAADGAVKSGYVYEYLQETASHAGWKYQYVYGTFSELYEKFVNGEIDLLPYISYTDERAKQMLFPDLEMGEELFYIASMDDTPLSEDLHELEGKSVGTMKDAYHNGIFRNLLKEKGVNCNLMELYDSEDRWVMLESGLIDYSIETSVVFQNVGLHPVYQLKEHHPFYLAVSKKRPDVLSDLNRAQAELAVDKPGFTSELAAKYFKSIPFFKELSADGKAWLQNHDVIRIGTYVNDAPLVIDEGNGRAGGISGEYTSLMLNEYGIDTPVYWKFYPSTDEMLKALNAGEIDTLYPYYPNYNDAEADGVVFSVPVFSTEMSILYLGEYTPDTIGKIATPNTRLGAKYVRDNYPGSEIIPCQDGYECMDKLLAGEANCIIMNSAALNRIAAGVEQDCSIKTINTLCDLSFAALPENRGLISIFNKAAPLVSKAEKNTIESRYFAEDLSDVTAQQFFAQHPEFTWIVLVIILSIALILFINGVVIYSRHRRQVEAERDRAETEIKRYNLLHDIMHSGKWMFEVDAADRITHAFYSDELKRIVNYDLSDEPYSWAEIVHPDDRKEAVERFNAAIRDHSGETPFDVVNRMRDRNGVYHWFHSAGRVIRNEDGSGEFFGIHTDISAQIEAEERLVRITNQANHDALTGVGSARWYAKRKEILDSAIASGEIRPFAVVECDANNLKEVNDGFGHEAGNEYLCEICRTICDTFAHSRVFRTGGDEFVVMLEDRDYEKREELLAAARKAASSAVLPSLEHKFCGASFACGMGVFVKGGDTSVDDVFRRADADMYANKNEMKSPAGAAGD